MNKTDVYIAYEKKLPQVVMHSAMGEIEQAISILDDFLLKAKETPQEKDFERELYSWKGMVYLENKMYADAIKTYRLAENYECNEIGRFNIIQGLVNALVANNNQEEAMEVLENGFDKIQDKLFEIKLLSMYTEVFENIPSDKTNVLKVKLEQIKKYYKIAIESSDELKEEIIKITKLIEKNEAEFSRLELNIRKAETPDQKLDLIASYLTTNTLEYFKQQVIKVKQEITDRLKG